MGNFITQVKPQDAVSNTAEWIKPIIGHAPSFLDTKYTDVIVRGLADVCLFVAIVWIFWPYIAPLLKLIRGKLPFTLPFRYHPLDGTLLIECEWGKLPDAIPPGGTIYIMQINEPQAPQTIGLGKIPGKPGDKYAGWPVAENMAYRCRVKNYGDKPVFHVNMTFVVDYKAVVKHLNGAGSGESTGQVAEYPIAIPDIAAGGTFEFYAYSLSTIYALIMVPKTATLKQLGNDDWHTIRLRMVANAAFFLQPHVWKS